MRDRDQAANTTQQGCLAATGWADNRDDLTLAEAEIDFLKDLQVAVLLTDTRDLDPGIAVGQDWRCFCVQQYFSLFRARFTAFSIGFETSCKRLHKQVERTLREAAESTHMVGKKSSNAQPIYNVTPAKAEVSGKKIPACAGMTKSKSNPLPLEGEGTTDIGNGP